MARVVGIDLGTTNSLVAVLDADGPRCLPNPENGEVLLPSAVSFLPGGEIVVTNRFDRPAEAEQWRRTWNEAELEAHNGFWAIVRRISRPPHITRPTILSMHLSLHTHGTKLRKRWAFRRAKRASCSTSAKPASGN